MKRTTQREDRVGESQMNDSFGIVCMLFVVSPTERNTLRHIAFWTQLDLKTWQGPLFFSSVPWSLVGCAMADALDANSTPGPNGRVRHVCCLAHVLPQLPLWIG